MSRSKSSAARRRAVNARDTDVSKKLSPTMQKRADDMMKKYNEIMIPKRQQLQESDKVLLQTLFQAFQGTNKAEWHIIDPIMAEVFPNSFYV